MASYTQYTLSSLTTEISNLLDDIAQVYWTPSEIQYAVQEALYVWGALTSCWRSTESFPTVVNTTYYDLSVQLPDIRTRNWTLGQMVTDIQYAILEAPNGISGSGMSGQTSITAILNAINRARNRFILDTVLPFSVTTIDVASPPTNGIVNFGETVGYLHKASWQDTASGTWYNLFRQDNWAADAALNNWLANPNIPRVFTESNDAPLALQLVPPAQNAGTLEIVNVASLMLDLTSGSTTFDVPDEWIHAIKWGALSSLLSSESKINDPLRAAYAEMRYNQAVSFAANAKSIIRMTYNNVPLMIDTLFEIDTTDWTWRNQSGPPQTVGVMYDLIAVNPGMPDNVYTLVTDVVQAAPIPMSGSDDIQVGPEDIDHLIKYICHILTFKCGGKEFQSSYDHYNDFMTAVSFRNSILKAKIQFLKPTDEQPTVEEADRPDVYNLQSVRGRK